jgi:hypothetical protein
LIGVNRLRKIIEGAFPDRVHGGANCPFLADENKLRVWRNAADLVHERNGISPPRVERFHYEIEKLFFGENECLAFIRGDRYLITMWFERIANRTGRCRISIQHEDVNFGGVHGWNS